MTRSGPDEDGGGAADVIDGIAAGSRAALARSLTWVERADPRAAEVCRALVTLGRRPGHVIGVTGAPGAGKSTLIGALVASPVYRNRRVAVLLLDAVSPVSGGALLGDRVRFGGPARETLFVRSIPAPPTAQASLVHRVLVPTLVLLGAQGFEVVLVETVGAGQDPSPPVGLVDTLVMLVTPDAGDATQFRKRGVLELVDVVVLNRADAPGAAAARRDLATSLPAMSGRPVVETVATTGAGVAELAQLLVGLERGTDPTGADHRRHRARLLDAGLVDAAGSEFAALARETLAGLRAAGAATDVTPSMLLRAAAERVAATPPRSGGAEPAATSAE